MNSENDTQLDLYPSVSLKDGHLLLIEDQETIRSHVRAVMERTGIFSKITEAADGLEGFQKLLQQSADIDVILCDVEMPQIDGFKFLSLKSSKRELEEIPVIMLTTRGELENRLRGLELGASDYVLKPFDESELIARTQIQLKITRLVRALRRQTNTLEKLSNTDALTKIYNRRFFMQQFEKEFSRAQRHGGDISLVLCDIDYFKAINDNFGHQIGDNVLVDVARLLTAQARDHDFLARYGGEEFCLVLPETPVEAAMIVAERCRKAIENSNLHADGTDLNLRMSFGVSSRADSYANTAEDLLKKADIALYQAKEQGRNRSIQYHIQRP